MLEELLFADTEASHVAFLDEPRTPAGLIRLACALHAVSTSLAEIRDLLEWFGARLSERRGTKPATQFLRELKEEHRVADAEFLVDGMGYLTALARTDLDGELNYTDRNVVEKLFQTYTMRIGRFHETWNGGQFSAERWLTAYTHYYNHLRGHQALNDQPPAEQLEDSI